MKLKQWRILRPLVHSLAASATSQTVGEGRGLLGRDTIGGGEEGQDGGTVQWWWYVVGGFVFYSGGKEDIEVKDTDNVASSHSYYASFNIFTWFVQ